MPAAAPLRVAIVCVGDPSSSDEQSGGLPYGFGARRVQAALLSPAMPGVEVRFVESRGPDADAIVAELERFDPQVIGGSAYVWSFPTLVEVARRAKAARPDRLIVLGGPSARPAMFGLEPFRDAAELVDALVIGEGEVAMREIVQKAAADREALATVAGLLLPTPEGFRATATRTPAKLDTLASPHSMGLMPRGASASLETYRGCPLECTFCEWGAHKLRSEVHSEAALTEELGALRELGAQEVFLVDAALNLNRRALGNLMRAEARVRLFDRAVMSCEVYATHLRPEDYEFLARCRTRRIGVGLQSFNPGVLEAMHRPFDEARFLDGVSRLADVAPGTIEIILGLPGDDPDSFRRTLERSLRLPCRAVHVFHCLVLPDGLMTRAPKAAELDFDPITLQMRSCRGFTRDDFATLHTELAQLLEQRGGRAYEDGWEIPAS